MKCYGGVPCPADFPRAGVRDRCIPIVSIDRWYNRCILENNFHPVEFGNPAQISQVVIRILNDRAYADRLAARSKRFVIGKRNWDYYLDRYLAIYAELIQANHFSRE